MSRQSARSSSSRKGVYINSHPDDLGPNVHTFTLKQLRNDSGHILGESLKRKIDAIEASRQEKITRLDGPSRSASPDQGYEILSGSIELNPSHAGGELLAILFDEVDSEESEPCKNRDHRTRRDRVQNLVHGFNQQMDHMVSAFMRWDYSCQDGTKDRAPVRVYENGTGWTFHVVDVFAAYEIQTDIEDGEVGIPSSLILHGMIPSSPYKPQHAFAIRVLELFDTIHMRSPHLSIEGFVKSLCDLHTLPYRPPMAKQFSIAYDVFIQIRNEIQQQVMSILKRDSINWRLRNACSACTYKTEGEPPLKFSMLITMDGNDSLKRVLRKSVESPEDASVGTGTIISRELPDSRKPFGDYYLSREEVNHFSGQDIGSGTTIKDDSPCAARWNNMSKEKISRMWSVFDESGFFLSLCRHGYTMVAADMVQSGEQSKYPLAVVSTLLGVFGSKLGVGYDIGCRFSKTIARSTLGSRAKDLEFTSLVGSFHGHAHNRLCQLSNLATYVNGMGLEDLEGCERFFSKSNALASSLRYASTFHRQQKIVEFMKHMDKHETSQQLSEFLVNNYKQSLKILKGEEELRTLMEIHGIAGVEIFHTWLKEEHEYLKGLTKEPTEETLEMEYYLKLQELEEIKKNLISLPATEFIPYDPSNVTRANSTLALRRYHAQERYNNTSKAIEALEEAIQPTRRWEPGMQEWDRVAGMVLRRNYQRALDNLERLVVQRMFELTQMNMSHTCYKMRKHISEGIRTRSHAIQTALAKYNTAASELRPPQDKLDWDTVVEYSFLADFDLLRDTRQDIRQKPWASPAGRSMMNRYFKIQRAQEEITRLNIEIQRVITHLHDESQFLCMHEKGLTAINPILGYQVRKYRLERLQYSELHFARFQKLGKIPGFTGTLTPGVSIDQTLHDLQDLTPVANVCSDASTPRNDDNGVEDNMDDDNGVEDNMDDDSGSETEGLEERFQTLMTVAY